MSMPYVRIYVMNWVNTIHFKSALCLNPKYSEWSTVNNVADTRKFHEIQEYSSVDPMIFHSNLPFSV